MLNAAIIASIPVATSLASTVLEQVREGSESFAAALSDALQPPQSNLQLRGASPSGVQETFDDLVGSLRSHAEGLNQMGNNLLSSVLNSDAMSQLRELIRDRLQSAGIDDLQDIQLELNPSDGRLAVVGDHPDKGLIESTLANDPTVADAIAQLTVARLTQSIGSALRLKLDTPDVLATSE